MTVEVRYIGHLGNNLFEYALGRIVAEHLDQALLCVPARDMPGFAAIEKRSGIVDRLQSLFEHFPNAPQTLPGREIEEPQLRYVRGEEAGWRAHSINLDHVLREGAGKRVVLHGYFQRTEYYHPHRARIREWFRMEGPPRLQLGPRDVLVHVRRSLDMYVLRNALTTDYQRRALDAMQDVGRVFLCGLGIDGATLEALAPYAPTVLDLDGIETLRVMTHAQRIVMANSTFSWWGAYLSDAREIWCPRPIHGVWSRDQHEIDLEVPDPRYHYVDDCPVEVWRPLSRAANGTIRVVPQGGETIRVVALRDGRDVARFDAPADLIRFTNWFVTRDAPFGPEDLWCLDLGHSGLQAAVLLLARMHDVGVVTGDRAAMEALMWRYGLRVHAQQGT